MKKLGCIFVLAVVVVLGLVALAGVGSYNRLVNLSQAADAQWAQVQNVYQRRADLIPNLVATVSGAANFEKSTLTEVTNARASVGKVQINAGSAPTAQQLQEFEAAQGGLGSALSRLLVVAERYPDLKSSANFQTLQSQLEGSENRIAVERGRFNDMVMNYNAAIRHFPTVLFAGALGFAPKPYFSATAGAEKPPQVDFSGTIH